MVGIWSTHPATYQCHLNYCQETFSSEYELDRHRITVNHGVEEQDSLFTLTRLQDIIPEKEVKLIRMTTLQEINPECTIVIKNTKNKIHYVSEWDPRKHAATKGGYLEGEITIPQYSRPIKMTIQTLPAHGKGMKKAIEAGVHPALIHNVIMGRGKRDQGKEPVPTECNWRLEYLIENGRVIALNKISKFDAGRNVPQQNEVTQVKNNKIILGGKRNELSLIIVQPKQRSRGDDATEATLPRVIINKLEATGQDASDINVQELEKCFKGAEFNKNMKQVGLNVDLRDYNTNEPIASCLTSQPICDFTNMHIGPLDLADASPLKSCTNGGRKIMIISEQKLPNKVKPIFEIWSGDSQMKDLEKYLSQPIDFQVRQESIIFLTPHQGFLKGMDWNNLTLKLAVMRTEDKHISSKKFSFRYVPHNSQSCMFCSHNLDTEEQVKIVENKKPKKGARAMVRNMAKSALNLNLNDCQSTFISKDDLEKCSLAVDGLTFNHGIDWNEDNFVNNKKSGKRTLTAATDMKDNKTIDDYEMKTDVLSEGYYSPRSMNVSSPEEAPSSCQPSYKKTRYETPDPDENMIPTPVLELNRSNASSTLEPKFHTQINAFSDFIAASDPKDTFAMVDVLKESEDVQEEDLNDFYKYADTLPSQTWPDIFSSVMPVPDGANQSVYTEDCTSNDDDDAVCNENKMPDTAHEKPKDLHNLLSSFPTFVFLFFLFFFLQVMACIFAFEEEDIPLLDISTSSLVFSATTIFMEL
eukprot:GFUD01019107.1.p1 GENE.GFUD01019107.1~~GFUD01019107.1.p1  ORF type:complete len:753 (+),score=165.35 GFUD01019107.1:306-2564(+)